MIIVVSDFHLMDGTAGAHYVEPGVFSSTMTDLAAHAREAAANEITLVFLGDVYDLYRTERWFDYPLEQRPWGSDPSAEALIEIFEGVVSNNRETFEMLSGSLVDEFDFPVEPRRVYIPGNHDRIVNEFPELRRRVRETLGMEPGDEPFERYILDEEHGLWARHGHEWDGLNFERSEAFDNGALFIPEADYQKMPVGDVMACELASKFAPLVAEYLGEDHPHRNRIAERMRDVVDVRPLVGMVRWCSWQVSQFERKEQDAINQALSDAAASARSVPWVKDWIKRNDHFGLDAADTLQAMLRLLKSFKAMKYHRILATMDKAAALREGQDHYAVGAASDFARLDEHLPDVAKNIYYVMYGHTHFARQQPVQVIGEPPTERYRVYFNTGTWRPSHRMLLSGEGFASWKEITYCIIYKPGEIVSGGHTMDYPAVEAWTGTVVVGRGRRATTYQPIPKIVRHELAGER